MKIPDELCPCPACSVNHDFLTRLTAKPEPVLEKCYTVCSACGALLKFSKPAGLQKIANAELQSLRNNDMEAYRLLMNRSFLTRKKNLLKKAIV